MANTLKTTSDVQDVKCKIFSLSLADFMANSNVIDVAIPAGAVVTAGFFNVTTAFSGSSADTIAVGDSGSATRYKSATSSASTGLTALVPTGYEVTGAETSALRITRAVTGTATTGAVDVCVCYVIKGNSESNFD